MKTVCVLGLGYIGLPTACMLANNGYRVSGIDVNDEVIDKLNSGNPHIDEPELEGIFKKAFKEGTLKVSKNVQAADIFIISVPTPLKAGRAEMSYVEEASSMIKGVISAGNLVILESTSPPGTTENTVGRIITGGTGLKAGEDYYLAFCPERVLPGKLIYELVYNDRVIGGIDRRSAEKAGEVYRSFSSGKFYMTDLKTAEFVKLAENTYRDVNIAFSNELSAICRDYGIDVWEIVKTANKHPRVNILNPGPGVGGHCIPIDPWFILEGTDRKDTLIEKARHINDSIPYRVADMAADITGKIRQPRIAILGASYKENVDDTRESPTAALAGILMERGLEVSIHDPVARSFKYGLSSLEDTLRASDMIILMVGHDDFRDLDLENAAALMRNRYLLDTRNFFEPGRVREAGFVHISI